MSAYTCIVIAFHIYISVGNKIDAERREIQESDVNQMLKSQNLDIPYFEISAEENLNVEHVSYWQ